MYVYTCVWGAHFARSVGWLVGGIGDFLHMYGYICIHMDRKEYRLCMDLVMMPMRFVYSVILLTIKQLGFWCKVLVGRKED